MSTPKSSKMSFTKALDKHRQGIKPQSVNVAPNELVETGSLAEGLQLPLVVRPRAEGVDLSDWGQHATEFISTRLLRHGGILFRGFGLRTQDDFDRFVGAVCSEPMHYTEGATPRTQLNDKIYTSTEFPPDQHIALHNELSYVNTWPMKIWFFCLQPAQQDGATPIADMRKVHDRVDEQVRARFAEKGWMLVRNYGDGLGLPWQNVFHTDDPSEVEAYCRANQIEYEWKDGNRLRTHQVRPAITNHPVTDEPIWFNHVAFWHVSSLEPGVRKVLLDEFGEQGLPYNTYYGDGAPIEDTVVEALRSAYDAETIAFPWEQGDLLMLDNMLVAHGRQPFVGPRRVLVAMGEPFSRGSLEREFGAA